MKLEVLLANRGNPDFRQDETRPLPGTPADTWIEVESGTNRSVAEAASFACRAYIAAHCLGAGNWAGGLCRNPETQTIVGHVSYNGCFWEGPRP